MPSVETDVAGTLKSLAAEGKLEERLSLVAEGKTKRIFSIDGIPSAEHAVLVRNKDRITAFNNVRGDDMVDKGRLSNLTNAAIFRFLGGAGIRTHFLGRVSETEFAAESCGMVPLEWIARRVATGSFLKRFPGVTEGTRFSPPRLEICLKDDAAGDPVWSLEQIQAAGLTAGPKGRRIGPREVEEMSRVTIAVFEVLERAWATRGCSLVDMKVEFGVNHDGEILLADVIDSDSWRLWPSGDKRLQLDKQFYRDLVTVTPEALAKLKSNFQHVVDELQAMWSGPPTRVVVLMGSASDAKLGEEIRAACARLAIPALLRVTSAHKGTAATLAALAEYEGDGVATVVVAVAGRSNGLGPVAAGNTSLPVLSCPPLGHDWGAQDVWSSLRLPSGLGCPTVLGADAAALAAAAILAAHDHRVFARLRVARLNNHLKLLNADGLMTAGNEAAMTAAAHEFPHTLS